MCRYFLEIAYKGTNYCGLASQSKNTNVKTVQGLIENALSTILKKKIATTTSSRTDAGVHALQNYLHFDYEEIIPNKILYNLNCIIPIDIVVKNIHKVSDNAHSRFDAIAREYKYFINTTKNAFTNDTAWHFPYPVNIEKLIMASNIIKETTNFESFCKRHTDVFTFDCIIKKSNWEVTENNLITYEVEGNRFLRGMVKGLVGTMLKVGTGYISIDDFVKIIEAKDCTKANFSTPSHGLFLQKVIFPEQYFQ